MWYVSRWPEGDISAASQTFRFEEEVADDDPELVAFFETAPPTNPAGFQGFWVATSVTNVQMRRALRAMGLFEMVDGYLRQPGADVEALESWEYANVFLYSDPLLDPIVSALSLDKRALFALALTK
jgi:hypothetical protein